jgi:hypothetical protein
MRTRIKRKNLRTCSYTEVADFVFKSIQGEPGRFGVYVGRCGTTNVLKLKNNHHNPRPDDELVGVFTDGVEINVIEDALLERKRELSRIAA